MHGFPRADPKLSWGKTRGISTSSRVYPPPVYFLANDRDRETIDGDISDPPSSLSLSPLLSHLSNTCNRSASTENRVHYVNFIPYRVQLNSLRVSRMWSGSDSKKLMKPPA